VGGAAGQVVCLKERRVAELGAQKDMLNEVKLLQLVQHPNVVACFGSFWDSQRASLFLVLEYVCE
jgi:serine/threonine protein kinase